MEHSWAASGAPRPHLHPSERHCCISALVSHTASHGAKSTHSIRPKVPQIANYPSHNQRTATRGLRDSSSHGNGARAALNASINHW
jgi:hypothetical protein